MKKIEFGEVRITETARKHVLDCLDNNYITCGPKVQLFEEKWRNIFNYPYTTAVNSGTSAVLACCLSLYDFDAEPGDYIICPALSFIATANAIRAAGFKPIFVDIKKETLNIDENKIEEVINSAKNTEDGKLVGIIAVNLMGKPSRLDIISKIAQENNVKLIVDNCEAYGSKIKDNFSLKYADMETTSHYVAHIICGAQLGTVSTKDKSLNNIIRSVKSHGRYPESLYFNHERFGLNLQPTDLHASIALGEVDDFWKIFNRRKETIKKYREAVSGLEDKAYFIEEDEDCSNAPHGFSITLKEKYANIDSWSYLITSLDNAGIHWKRNFGSMSDHGTFEYLKLAKGYYKNATYVGAWGLHIGCHYWLTDENVDYVCESLKNIIGNIK